MTPEEDRVIDEVTQRVHAKYPTVQQQEVRDLVTRTHHSYDESRIRDFVPVLVEREVLDQVRSAGSGPRI